MQVGENRDFTRDYYDPAKRYIGNAVQVFFRDGSATERVAIDYPIGHRLRRAEALPLLRRNSKPACAVIFGDAGRADPAPFFRPRGA